MRQNYPVDLRMLRRGAIDDGTMRFSDPAPAPQSAAATQALASSS